MGQVTSYFRRDVVVGAQVEEKYLDNGEVRRKNSLAASIAQFINFEGEDYTPLIEEIKKEKLGKFANKMDKMRVSKFGKIADDIAQGNIREFRNQVFVQFRHINRPYKDHHAGNTLLHIVCQEGYYSMVEYMLNPLNRNDVDTDIYIEINSKNDKERIPLFLCFTPPIATFTGIRFGVDEDGNPKAEKPEGVESLSDWCKPGGPKSRENAVKILLQEGADVNMKDYQGFTALHYAAMWGWTSTCKLLLEFGADINAQTVVGRTPLMYAIDFGHETTIEFFITKGRDFRDAYRKYQAKKDARAQRISESRGRNLSGKLFNFAEEKKEQPSEEEDLRAGMLKVDATDVEGYSALLVAAERTDELALSTVKLLMQHGADPNIMTFRRKTALKIACQSNNIDLIKLLISVPEVERRKSAFNLLHDEEYHAVMNYINEEENKAEEQRKRKEREDELRWKTGKTEKRVIAGHVVEKNPNTAWVEYRDKKTKKAFYYNTVTRRSLWDRPPNFKPDKNRIIKDVVFGLSFYH